MRQISIDQLKEILAKRADFFLLDVRTEAEHNEFDIGGVLIPSDEVIRKASAIPIDRPVVVYCSKGIRSGIAVQRLEEKFGFTNLINLKGGIEKLRL